VGRLAPVIETFKSLPEKLNRLRGSISYYEALGLERHDETLRDLRASINASSTPTCRTSGALLRALETY
jgi:hypothetical protein